LRGGERLGASGSLRIPTSVNLGERVDNRTSRFTLQKPCQSEPSENNVFHLSKLEMQRYWLGSDGGLNTHSFRASFDGSHQLEASAYPSRSIQRLQP
jgi:hypothetical protein